MLALGLVLEQLLNQFLAEHRNDPILVQIAGDGTPVGSRQRTGFNLFGTNFTRQGDGKC